MREGYGPRPPGPAWQVTAASAGPRAGNRTRPGGKGTVRHGRTAEPCPRPQATTGAGFQDQIRGRPGRIMDPPESGGQGIINAYPWRPPITRASIFSHFINSDQSHREGGACRHWRRVRPGFYSAHLGPSGTARLVTRCGTVTVRPPRPLSSAAWTAARRSGRARPAPPVPGTSKLVFSG